MDQMTMKRLLFKLSMESGNFDAKLANQLLNELAEKWFEIKSKGKTAEEFLRELCDEKLDA